MSYAFNTVSYRDASGVFHDVPRTQILEQQSFRLNEAGHTWNLSSTNKLSVESCSRGSCTICKQYGGN